MWIFWRKKNAFFLCFQGGDNLLYKLLLTNFYRQIGSGIQSIFFYSAVSQYSVVQVDVDEDLAFSFINMIRRAPLTPKTRHFCPPLSERVAFLFSASRRRCNSFFLSSRHWSLVKSWVIATPFQTAFPFKFLAFCKISDFLPIFANLTITGRFLPSLDLPTL